MSAKPTAAHPGGGAPEHIEKWSPAKVCSSSGTKWRQSCDPNGCHHSRSLARSWCEPPSAVLRHDWPRSNGYHITRDWLPIRRSSPGSSGDRSPARGGGAQAVARRRSSVGLFGATGGGSWKTTDGGLTWRPVSDTSFTSSSVGAVAVSESIPTHPVRRNGQRTAGNILQGDGVYKST